MSTVAPTHKHTFLLLDALRGVAALAVVIYHYYGNLHDYTKEWPPSSFLAVDFFFLLSGFVIMHAYAARLQTGMSWLTFFVLRLIRLYPLYFFGTTISLIAGLIGAWTANDVTFVPLPSISYFLSLAFLPSPPLLASLDHTNNIFVQNSPSWSLSLEMGINIIFALICAHMTFNRWRLLTLFGGLCFLGALWFYHDPNVGWNWETYWGGVARILFSFFAGVVLCNYFHSRQQPHIAQHWGIVLICLLFATFCIPRANEIYAAIACFGVFPLVVWYGAHITVSPLLGGFCGIAGRLSYVIYITHKPLLDVFISSLQWLGIDFYPHPRVMTVVFTLAAILVALLLDRFYDVPIRTYLGQKYRMRYGR